MGGVGRWTWDGLMPGQQTASWVESASGTKAPRRFRAAKPDVMAANQRIFLRQAKVPLVVCFPGISHQEFVSWPKSHSTPKYHNELPEYTSSTRFAPSPTSSLRTGGPSTGITSSTSPKMSPRQPLPLPPQFTTADAYISSLLSFSHNPLFQTLCGGVHILDFFTRDSPVSSSTQAQDLYHTILPAEWITYFSLSSLDDIIELILRVEVSDIPPESPESLTSFIADVRAHSLRRGFERKERVRRAVRKSMGAGRKDGEEWALNAGMKPKKIHEVEHFSEFVDDLVNDIAQQNQKHSGITHIVDFGSGQAYLSRTLARKYNHHVVGIESKTANIEGAREMDERFDNLAKKRERKKKKKGKDKQDQNEVKSESLLVGGAEEGEAGGGSLQYIEKRIENGNLGEVVDAIQDLSISPTTQTNPPETEAETHISEATCTNGSCPSPPNPPSCALTSALTTPPSKRLLLISLHSCGNLVHHALHSFTLTPTVHAVALIGCCYNLMTEKLGPTFKPPFRTPHPRLISTSTSTDPHGFPLSNLLTENQISLNITARMMACQAPQNWTKETSEAFFTRHFFRALLQRVFADKGVVGASRSAEGVEGASGGEPIIIGSLRKKCYGSFPSYVMGAISKLGWEDKVKVTEEEVRGYEERFGERKKDLSVLWCLMAFCAGVVESLIVVDRYVYLKEAGVRECWVEAAFEYSESPRNLVVVGVR